MSLILTVDQGTHATRAFLFDQTGHIRAGTSRPVALHHPRDDAVEQDPDEILTSVWDVMETVWDSCPPGEKIIAAALATQRSSVVAWDKVTGVPLSPVLSWQDRRAARWLAALESKAARIKTLTGLPLSPHYGASKLRWLLHHNPDVKQALSERCLAIGPLTSFILFHILEGNPLLVDHANASRTLLWNIAERVWDEELLALFDIPQDVLPRLHPTSGMFGSLRKFSIPLLTVNGDQNSAVYSLGAPALHTALMNLGTGAFVLAPTGPRLFRHPRLLSTLTASRASGGEYALEGTVNGAGAALSWAENQGFIPPAAASQLDRWINTTPPPPIFINTVGGLGSPWWVPGPPPRWDTDATPKQRAVAIVESILFMLRTNLEAILDVGVPLRRIRISGGLSKARHLCQHLANLTGMEVIRPHVTEATAQGAAWLAAGRPSRWASFGPTETFLPQFDARLQARYQRFRDLIDEAAASS